MSGREDGGPEAVEFYDPGTAPWDEPEIEDGPNYAAIETDAGDRLDPVEPEVVAQAAMTIRREPVSMEGLRRQRDELADALAACMERCLRWYEANGMLADHEAYSVARAALRKAGWS